MSQFNKSRAAQIAKNTSDTDAYVFELGADLPFSNNFRYSSQIVVFWEGRYLKINNQVLARLENGENRN